MSKRTPGPWCVDFGAPGHPYYYVIAGATPEDNAAIVATVRSETNVGPRGDESRANAILIASAPELLEALKDAHSHIADGGVRARIGNVIANAEGVAT